MNSNQLLQLVSIVTGIDEKLILSKKRDRNVVTAKFMLYHFLRHKFKWTLKQIGEYNNIDHSSVIYALYKIDTFLEIEDELITDLYNKINFAYKMATKEPTKVLFTFENDIDIDKKIYDICHIYKCSYKYI